MKYLPKFTTSLLAVSVLALPVLPSEANARSSFSFGVSSGPGYYDHYPHRHHWRGHHRGYHHGHYARYYGPPPVYYVQPQPVYINAPVQTAPSRQLADDQYCREYTRTVMVGGKKQQAYGNACMQEDGSWEIVD